VCTFPIRRADEGWAGRLALLHAAAVDEPWPVPELVRWLDMPTTIALVAEDDGAAIGFVLAQAVVDEAEILTLAVRPDARRHGIARALLAALVDHLARQGIAALFLDVAADNAGALALYRADGFAATGHRRGYYERGAANPVDAVLMVRPIARANETTTD
jgi:ribosomal-protein-alanine N-acetyltransferase